MDRDGHSLHTPRGQACVGVVHGLCDPDPPVPIQWRNTRRRSTSFKDHLKPHSWKEHRRPALVTSSENTQHVHPMPLPPFHPSTCHDNSHCRHTRSEGRVPSLRAVGKEQSPKSPRTILFVSVRFKPVFYCLTPNRAIYSLFFQTLFKAGICKQDICPGCRDENIVRNALKPAL